MARKADKPEDISGFGDIIGIVLFSSALLLLISLFSYDVHDVSANSAPANDHPHNWIGSVGAWVGYAFFFVFGAGAFVLPVLLMGFGLGYLFQMLNYLRHCWLWGAVLFFCSLCLMTLYNGAFTTVTRNINAPSSGGVIGLWSQNYIFQHFGKPGATIVLLTLYVISLLYLTNFQLGGWLRELWLKRQLQAADMTEEELALEKKARELEKQARKLQEKVDRASAKSGKSTETATVPNAEAGMLGADMQPVPEPTIRDLSVPSARPGKSKKNEPQPKLTDPMQEGDIISATEIAAASTSDILGADVQLTKANKKETKPGSTPTPAGEETAVGGAESPLQEAAVIPPPAQKPRPGPKKPKPITVASTPTIGNYQLPTIDLLNHPDLTVKPTESREELMANAKLMQNTLKQFQIEVQLGDITKGPTITRYELHPAPGVKLEKISALTNNIAAALKAERINILAPVPGKSSVGVEVPNLVKTKVIMRDLLESDEWINSKARIPVALGKDVYGHPIIADLAEMPHLLIAGSTGSGKSVCINSIIASLLFKFSPDQLRFVMIDPKVVELQTYNSLPHLVVPVVNDPKKVILALRWVVNEMEKRYQIFAKVGVRNIKSFNERPKNKPIPPSEPELPLTVTKEKVEPGQDGFAVELDEEIVVPRDEDIVIPEKLSYVVVIIDELADLMLVAPADVEMAIARITQMARAAGIHCIVATQRPSVDVITGVIKANIPARIAFQVAAKVDSRTILDAMGADKLLGKGDMLYLPPGSAKLTRIQGVLITDQEIQDMVDGISKQGKPSYEMEITQQLSKPAAGGFGAEESGCDEDEDLIQQCIEVIRSEQKASVSLMQRRLRLGYTRAARIMDELENRGVVGPSKGAEPRDILIDLDGGGAAGNGEHGK
ncbi:MAG: spoIIIE [Verrucomicrobiales bacterium]|nr:spoIIIE [Verrucomicrobiales bacterium]